MSLPRDAEYAHAVGHLIGAPRLDYQLRDLVVPLSQENLAGTGYAHTSAVVLLPRQVGKTSTLFQLLLARMMHRTGYAAAYTAQTGHTVTERFSEPGAWVDQVMGSPLRSRHRVRRSQGTERITNTRTGSFVKAFPPTPGKLRSNALDCVVLDECQEHDWRVGRALESDIGPVFSTRKARQLIMAGTASGPGWWRTKYEEAQAGQHLLIEVGTWPAGAEVTDPATWAAHHPGLQAGLTDAEHLHAELKRLGPQTFAREYGNAWDSATTTDAPVPLPAWDACPPPLPGAPAAVAFDVTPDRSWCSVVGVTTSGTVRVLHTGPPATLPAALTDVAQGMTVYCLPGQAGTAVDLSATGAGVRVVSATDYRQACQRFHDAVVRGLLHHDDQPQLRQALAQAGRAWHGDTWVLSARASDGDITAAAAAVVAWHAALSETANIL